MSGTQLITDPLYRPLIANIRELVAIQDTDLSEFLRSFEVVRLGKKQILLEKGERSHHMRFVSEGCLRAFYIDEKGSEYTIQFGISGWWVNDLYSYLSNTPALDTIQAILPSVVLQIHRDALESHFDGLPQIERFFRLKMQSAYVALQKRTLRSMSEPLEQRYARFIRTYRDIEQRVPQYMIASYLGSTPEHLSKVRKSLFHK